jgi:hypothetical protein
MADVEASVTRASGAEGSGCDDRVPRDKLALHSSKDLQRSGVHVIGCELLTLGPEGMSCSGAWVAAACGLSMPRNCRSCLTVLGGGQARRCATLSSRAREPALDIL